MAALCTPRYNALVTHSAIYFGTSGWRGIIADDFTFEGVRRASAAIAAHLRAQKKNPTLIVAHDTRFFSEEFARASAAVLQSEGCRILLCSEPCPTPAVAHAIIHNRLDGGINITASHNPYNYNGLKFSGPEGGPALAEVTKDIEKRAAQLTGPTGPVHDSTAKFDSIDPRAPYFRQLEKMVRFETIKKANSAFAFDAVHGCGAGWLDRILADHSVRVTTVRSNRDVLFDGTGPDPSEENLGPLANAVRASKACAGLATDGDADRFGILDRDASFISPNHILGLLFDYLLETRGQQLGASRSVATTSLLDAVARLHKVPLYETPVGFKYVGPLLRDDKIAIGGEESAGLTIRGHLPEKDGILACLLVAEMIAGRRASLADQLRDLFRRVGAQFWPLRENLHLPPDVQARVPERLRQDPKEIAGRKVAHVDRTDGLKLILEGDAWVLMRPSGTEPLVRIYSEAAQPAESRKLADAARAWITQ